MKVVVNRCYGGFGLSEEATRLYLQKKGIEFVERENSDFSFREMSFFVTDENGEEDYFSDHVIKRDDPALVEVVEELGNKAGDSCAALAVLEIPDDVSWHLEEYDGIEWVAEDHRTWP